MTGNAGEAAHDLGITPKQEVRLGGRILAG
jgi:hypothetical protein